MWAIEVPPGQDVESLVVGIYQTGVAVGFAGRLLRILPPATIQQEHLERACRVVRQALLRECTAQVSPLT